MDLASLNWLAILVAALAGFAVGSLWYSSFLFGKAWQKETGITTEKAKSANMGKIMGLAFVLMFLISFNLAAFLGATATIATGILYGALAGIFWVTAALGVTYLFEMQSTKLWLINGGYHAVTFTIMGGILGAWH